MKVRRKPAKPWNGEPLPRKLAIAIAQGKASIPPPSQAIWPEVEATKWLKHGDHPKVRPIPEDHFHAKQLKDEGKDHTTHGHTENMAGHLCLVAPGHWIMDYPDGLIHHGVEDIFNHYDIV